MAFQRPAASADARLTPAELNRLIGILGRLGSEHDGERSAAGLLASRLVRDRGLQWADLVQAPALPQPEPTRSTATDLAVAARHLNCLEAWPRAFIANLVAHPGRPLSPRQGTKLREIADALLSQGLS